MAVSTRSRFLMSAAAAGAVSAVVFAALHDWLISDIWFTLPLMVVAAVLSGVALAWSYRLLFAAPSPGSWWAYNGLHVGLLTLLGVASLIVYEPITTVAELMASPDPPRELTRLALPLSFAWVVITALVIQGLWGRTLRQFGAVLVAATLLVFLLGLNISVIGLVELNTSAVPLIGVMLGLIVVLAAVFAVGLLFLERRSFRPSPNPRPEHAESAHRRSI